MVLSSRFHHKSREIEAIDGFTKPWFKHLGKLVPKDDSGVPETTSNRRMVILFSVFLWFIVVAAGLLFLWSYENTPGFTAAPPRRWPDASRIKPTTDRVTLVMLIHPQCPCTRASLEELDKLMAHCRSRMDAYVVIMKPVGLSDAWVKTDLWRNALKIPGGQRAC